MRGSGVSLDSVIATISARVGRPVVDETGLTGKYDVLAQWNPGDAAALPPSDGSKALPSDSGPSIFTAIQEQLGLKLESKKGPVEIIVVDRAEKPKEN